MVMQFNKRVTGSGSDWSSYGECTMVALHVTINTAPHFRSELGSRLSGQLDGLDLEEGELKLTSSRYSSDSEYY
jgi:hypothetical protein